MEPTNKFTNGITDISLAITNKKKFRIDGDDNRILELNTSDIGIVHRAAEAIPQLQKLQTEVADMSGQFEAVPDMTESNIEETANSYKKLGDQMTAIDKKMRDLVDFIFDSNVSAIVAPSGTMYDLFDGVCRYEHILSTLMGLYEENLQAEYSRIEKRMKSHTKKYTK